MALDPKIESIGSIGSIMLAIYIPNALEVAQNSGPLAFLATLDLGPAR